MKARVKRIKKKPKEGVAKFGSFELDHAEKDSRRPLVAFMPSSSRREIAEARERIELRIPGALAIDPIIRNASKMEGIKASENAIWLVVVAAREYAKTILKSCADIKRSASQMKHLRVPQPRPHTLTYKPKPGEMARKPIKPAAKGEMQITALDVHTLLTQLPMGAVQSLGGTVSRMSYETTLMSTVDARSSFTGGKFEDVRRFVVSKIIPEQPLNQPQSAKAGAQGQAPKTAGKDETLGRISPHGGLGRGAKDLASLRARSSFTSRKEGENPSSQESNVSALHPNKPVEQTPSTTNHQPGSSPDYQQGDQGGARRGKGSGVKNLRAMLARNKPQKPGEHSESQGRSA